MAERIDDEAVHLAVDMEEADGVIATAVLFPSLYVYPPPVEVLSVYSSLPLFTNMTRSSSRSTSITYPEAILGWGTVPLAMRRPCRTGDPVPADAGSLLQGIDGLFGAVAVIPVGCPEPVAERDELLL